MMKKSFLFIITVVLLGADSVLAADCAEMGKKVAVQKSGVLVRSIPIIQDGKNMCEVVVIVPARGGEKLRRVEVSVPLD
ncbi:hypothetical protein V4B17_01315 [Bartonella sp. B23]